MVHVEGESLAIGIAMTVVDACVEDCAAHQFTSLYSISWRKKAPKSGIIDFAVRYVNDHTLFYSTTRVWDVCMCVHMEEGAYARSCQVAKAGDFQLFARLRNLSHLLDFLC